MQFLFLRFKRYLLIGKSYIRSCTKEVIQLFYNKWLAKFYIAQSEICLNTNSQIIKMWEGRKYITNNKQVSDKPIQIIFSF